MQISAGIASIFLALLVAACDRPSAEPAVASTSAVAANSGAPRDPWLDDGRPQTGLPRMKLYLGAKELDAELALTTAAIEKGVMWRTNIAETAGMLFAFGRPHKTAFWMKNVPIDIDVAYLDPDGVIREIYRLERQNTNPMPAKTSNIQFALETAEGWFDRNGIGPGVVVRTERGSLNDTFSRRAQ